MKVKIYRDIRGRIWWSLMGLSGQALCSSGPFKTLQGALKSARRSKENFRACRIAEFENGHYGV